ncbi:hypothetical protein PoB_001972800 [Plakobranchus ocellatus]|uniref:Uncharacterized protein n=1 Tax=Plakobranchus ocellatus TaxID=259542 RepID=A0AAV3ZF52_9GAST|nr:hypothetical protein PoB_001972800 [Plakobranchus ocellatus]
MIPGVAVFLHPPHPIPSSPKGTKSSNSKGYGNSTSSENSLWEFRQIPGVVYRRYRHFTSGGKNAGIAELEGSPATSCGDNCHVTDWKEVLTQAERQVKFDIIVGHLRVWRNDCLTTAEILLTEAGR